MPMSPPPGYEPAPGEPPVQIMYQPRSRRRKTVIGCAIILWFMLLLVPCFLFTMAINQQFAVATGSLPGQELRVWLVMEPFQRGLGISTAQVTSAEPLRACMTTETRYVLWQGRGDGALYCECFERAGESAPWVLAALDTGVCAPG